MKVKVAIYKRTGFPFFGKASGFVEVEVPDNSYKLDEVIEMMKKIKFSVS